MKVIHTLSLLLALAGAISLPLQAEEETPTPSKPAAPTPPAPKKAIQQTLTGRVVSLDRLGRTVTLQVNNLTYVLEITDSTRLNRNGKEQTFADFVVGEEITVNVMLRELANGRIEVAVINVDLPYSTEAQGAKRRAYGLGGTPPPFQNGPNPGNVDGTVVSPHR